MCKLDLGGVKEIPIESEPLLASNVNSTRSAIHSVANHRMLEKSKVHPDLVGAPALQLAAQRGNALGVLFRPRESAREASPAMLRVALEPRRGGVRVTLLKSRGGARGALDVTWQGPRSLPFDAGTLVLTLTLAGGGLLFALRLNRLPRPLPVIVLHGGAALLGVTLLVVGLVHG